MTLNDLMVMGIATLPVIELRGAIPYGVLVLEMDFWRVYFLAVIGNILPVPFLIPFAGYILRLFAKLPYVGFIFQKIIEIGEKKIAKIDGAIMMGLFMFVAVPLPGTGAWTGCLIATLLRMPLKKAVPPIALGVITSGIIVGVLSFGVTLF